jgi:hypothetical protein
MTAMAIDDQHQIGEQKAAHRRGLVLGLTMAEVAILIIFVLMLLIGLESKTSAKFRGKEPVATETLQRLVRADSERAEVLQALWLPEDASPEEIRKVVRALQDVANKPEGKSALQDAKAAIEEMRKIRDEIRDKSGSEKLAQKAEELSFRIANQEGQLQLYEDKLRDAGLGKGERPCWVRADGTIEYLYEVVLTSDGIRMREYVYPERERERELLPMPAVDPNEILSPEEFLRRTEPLYQRSQEDNCRYFVVVYDATGPAEKELYKRLLQSVEGHFYKRLASGSAPF